MNSIDVLIIGAGHVGLISTLLAKTCRLSVCIFDKAKHRTIVGKADALNARILQLV